MKQTHFKIFFLIACLSLLLGCKAGTVYNINESVFTAQPNTTLAHVKQAILNGSRQAGWVPKSLGPGKMIATYTKRGGKHSATVSIDYTLSHYSVAHLRSRNLKYRVKHSSGDSTQPDATIHKVYNKWVTQLESKINQELLNLPYLEIPVNMADYENNESKPVDRPVVRDRPVARPCNHRPTTQLSGQATVIRSRVNLRDGAGTSCIIVGSVAAGETFTLLGAKNNWYYASLSNGQSAWIYASLVKKITPENEIETFATLEPPPPPPRPAGPPRKKISIAVIQFKSLNMEAQKLALGDLISETFTSGLVNSSAFRIIERDQLDKVIKEMEMSQTGFIETTDAVQIGKILHADAIITGSVALLGGQIQVIARIIDIESAYVISAETKTTQYNLTSINRVVNEIVHKLSANLTK